MLNHSSEASEYLKEKFGSQVDVQTNTFGDSPKVFWEFEINNKQFYLLPDKTILSRPIPPKENEFLNDVLFPLLRKING